MLIHETSLPTYVFIHDITRLQFEDKQNYSINLKVVGVGNFSYTIFNWNISK